MKMPEPVAAQHRFRHPQKTTPDWSAWQLTTVRDSPPAHIDSVGYQVEYRLLYTQEQMREALAQQEAVMEQALEALEMYALWESPDDPARPATDAIKALEEALK